MSMDEYKNWVEGRLLMPPSGNLGVLTLLVQRVRRLLSWLEGRLARGVARLANAIAVLSLVCVTVLTTNTRVGKIRTITDPIRPGRASLRLAVKTAQAIATIAHPERRSPKDNDGEPIADQSAVCDTTTLSRTKERSMEDVPQTASMHTTEYKETNMSDTNTQSTHSITNADSRAPRDRKRGKDAPSTRKLEAKRPQGEELIIESEATAGKPESSPFRDKARCKMALEVPDQWHLMDRGQTAIGLSAVNHRMALLRECDLREDFISSVMAINGYFLYPAVCAVDGSIFIFNENDFVVSEVARDSWKFVVGKSLGHLFVDGEEFDNVVVLPGTRNAWIDTSLRGQGGSGDTVKMTRLVDLDGGRVLRAFSGLGRASLVVGSEPQRVFRNGYRQRSSIWSADGSSSIELEETPGWIISKLTVGISREGFLAARRLAARDRHGVEIVAFDATGALRCRTELPDCEEVTEMFTFPAGGHTLVRTRDVGTDDGRLLWFCHAGNRLVLEAVHSVPAGVVLMQDQSCGSAAYVVPFEGGFGMGAIDPVHGIEPQEESEV